MKTLTTVMFVTMAMMFSVAAGAADEKTSDATPQVSSAPPASVRATRPVYQPPKLGKPARTVGGGSRGSKDKVPALFVVAPEHVGQTASARPSLFYFIDRVPDPSIRVEFTLLDEESIEPLVETVLPTPKRAGVHRIRLADHGVKLAAGIEYEWSVSLVLDPNERSKDIVATSWIDRIPESGELKSRLASEGATAAVFAEEGLWYDAIGALSDEIDSDPADVQLAEQRADLLRQVGLDTIASGAVQ
ncbi:MAG: DUF928 domain-containing protein [Deltaproteobacteria bacterium]|nr:DUF928 domain-containing protein [Deltaproteobacteria bacterium]MBW2400344.1 DUF928 domain-containing protein [Deltaproteobacteria bacterium]